MVAMTIRFGVFTLSREGLKIDDVFRLAIVPLALALSAPAPPSTRAPFIEPSARWQDTDLYCNRTSSPLLFAEALTDPVFKTIQSVLACRVAGPADQNKAVLAHAARSSASFGYFADAGISGQDEIAGV